MARRLVVYGTRDCHLCEEMERALRALPLRPDVHVEFRDVEDDAGLRAHYGPRIPVLVGDGTEICAGRLEARALDAYFRKA